MDVQPLHAEDGQTVPLEQRLERSECEIENVLVIDGVELSVLDEIRAVRELQRDTAIWLEQGFEASDEVIRVRRVGEDVVAENQVGLAILRGEVSGDFLAEEFDERLDSLFARNFSDVCGGFDAEARNACLHEVLQQIAVVARDFDDEALAVEAELLHVAVAGFARMAEHEIRERRKI